MSDSNEIPNEALQTAAQVEATSRAQSVFLANMSHELRTPLNAILGFAQLLARDPAATLQQKEYFELIRRSGENLLGLLNDILDLAKIEAQRVTLIPAEFSPLEQLQEVAATWRSAIEAKGVAFTVTVESPVPAVVTADQGKWRQILQHLLENAAKFTDHGRIAVRLRARRETATQCGLILEVEDTGPGIAPEERDRLFVAFEQTAAGRAKGSGSGLGLAISRAYARLMGGDIEVHSGAEAGCRFVLALPVPVVRWESERVAEPIRQRPLVVRAEMGECRVLVADDLESNRKLIRRLLELCGLRVLEAKDGAEAVQGFLQWHPQAAIMDVRMPVMNGAEAIQRMRQLPGGQALKVIVLTASTLEDNAEVVRQCGADDFLEKPFMVEDFYAQLLRLLPQYFERPAEETPAATATAGRGAVRVHSVPLRAKLRQAVQEADLRHILVLAGEIEPAQPELARQIRALAARFDYGRLLELASEDPSALP